MGSYTIQFDEEQRAKLRSACEIVKQRHLGLNQQINAIKKMREKFMRQTLKLDPVTRSAGKKIFDNDIGSLLKAKEEIRVTTGCYVHILCGYRACTVALTCYSYNESKDIERYDGAITHDGSMYDFTVIIEASVLRFYSELERIGW